MYISFPALKFIFYFVHPLCKMKIYIVRIFIYTCCTSSNFVINILAFLIFQVCPALAMGNTVVLKPATFTRLSALLFAEICYEAGLPPGKIFTMKNWGFFFLL